MRAMDVFYAFPSVLLAVAISGALAAAWTTACSLTLVFVPPITRVAESAATQVRKLDFVEAARASGARAARMRVSTCWATCFGPVFVYASSLVSVCILLAVGPELSRPRRHPQRPNGA